jgi:hypothetical protein
MNRTFFTLRNTLRAATLLIAALMWLFLPWAYALFLTITMVWVAFRLDSRIIGGVALAFLLAIPALLLFGWQAQAETIAVYVFALLCITVLLQLVEFATQSKEAPARPLALTDVQPKITPYQVRYMHAHIDGIIPRNLLYGS